jgi:hypothetical protein
MEGQLLCEREMRVTVILPPKSRVCREKRQMPLVDSSQPMPGAPPAMLRLWPICSIC